MNSLLKDRIKWGTVVGISLAISLSPSYHEDEDRHAAHAKVQVNEEAKNTIEACTFQSCSQS